MNKVDSLFEFIRNSAAVRQIDEQLNEIREQLDRLEDLIDATETVSEEATELLAKQYNKLKQDELVLNLKRDHFSHKEHQAEFDLVSGE